MQSTNIKLLGPFDRRHRKSRCLPCVKRHVKCSGGTPCANCLRFNRECDKDTSRENNRIIFVNQSGLYAKQAVTPRSTLPVPQVNVCAIPQKHNSYITYFFSTFLPLNDWSGGFDAQPAQLLDLASRSSALCQCFVALSALHISRPNSLTRDQSQVNTRCDAIAAYQKSIALLRADLACRTRASEDLAPWATFFLGIFEVGSPLLSFASVLELMFDVTGERWTSHMLQGTSRLLSLREPHQFVDGSNRSFYLTIRTYEVIRALTFYDTTFLDHVDWKELKKDLWAGKEDRSRWHPIENLFELMILVSGLLSSVLNFIATQPEAAGDDLQTAIELGIKGCLIQSHLSNWNREMKAWTRLHSSDPDSDCAMRHKSQTLVGNVYYHTMAIYICAIFGTNRKIWLAQTVRDLLPTCSSDDVDSHVQAILTLTELALDQSNLAGLLFYLPLRIAGQRCTRDEDRGRVLSIISRIAERGFLVIKSLLPIFERLWRRDTAE